MVYAEDCREPTPAFWKELYSELFMVLFRVLFIELLSEGPSVLPEKLLRSSSTNGFER